MQNILLTVADRRNALLPMLDFFLNANNGCSTTPAILFNAVGLFDAYIMESNPVSHLRIDLIVLSCLWISSKFHDEEEFFYPEDLVKNTSYTVQELIEQERDIFFSYFDKLKIETEIDHVFKYSPKTAETLRQAICGLLDWNHTEESCKICNYIGKIPMHEIIYFE
jgi:hypothetical protein